MALMITVREGGWGEFPNQLLAEKLKVACAVAACRPFGRTRKPKLPLVNYVGIQRRLRIWLGLRVFLT